MSAMVGGQAQSSVSDCGGEVDDGYVRDDIGLINAILGRKEPVC